MQRHDLGEAIRAFASDRDPLGHELLSTIASGAPPFEEACNSVAESVARMFLAGTMDFDQADDVMNWVWTRIIDWLTPDNALPEPAFSIYEAFDAGEFHRQADPPDVDPVERYTTPALIQILGDD